MRCHCHKGMPEAGPRHPAKNRKRAPSSVRTASARSPGIPPRRRPSRRLTPEQRRERRIEAAAEFCADSLTSSWQDAVADHATDYVTDTTWRYLKRAGRRRQCRALAKIASSILAFKKGIHGLVGVAVGRVAFWVTASQAAEAFTREVATNIPLPPDAKLIAAARAAQVAGVLLCLVKGDSLLRCECFIALALNETKTQVKKILLAGASDWTNLARYPAKARETEG
jgi:hypothetical protein